MAAIKSGQNESDFLVAIANNHVQTVTGLSNFLERLGFRTVWAYAGGDAIKLCEKERPDLLLLDAQMPDVSGFDVARALPLQKILFMVADGDVGKKAMEFGNCVGTLHKPVDNTELETFLRARFNLKKPVLE